MKRYQKQYNFDFKPNIKPRRRLYRLSLILSLMTLGSIIYLTIVKNTNATQWWPNGGSSWKYRKQLTITNNSSANLSSATTIAITIDTKALFDGGKLLSNCDDLRILYQPSSTTTTELTRHIVYPSGTTCSTSTATKIFFNLQAALNSSSTITDYFAYYGNSGASAPSSTDNAFDIASIDAKLVCPFDGSTTCAASETPSTESGAVRYSSSKSAVTFDGFNDKVDIGDLTSTEVVNYLTWDFWVKPNIITATQCLLCKYNNAATQRSWAIATGTTNASAVRVTVPTSSTEADGTTYGETPTAQLTVGTWTHVAVVYDGTQTGNANRLKIYINGTSQSLSFTGTIPATTQATTSNATIGASSDGARFFPGVFDEVRISNSIRYASNFTTSTSPLIRDSNTIALFHFDENGDDPRNTGKAIDDSGNGNHGTITGAKYVSGLSGVDNGSSDMGNVSRQSYAAHEGMYIEEGTTNKITNPSFDHSTYDTNWHQITGSGQAYWRLEEASGNRADSLGSNTLTDNNSVQQISGKISNAASFNAGSAHYLDSSDNSALSVGNEDFSIAGWFYIDDTNSDRGLVAKGDISNINDLEYALYYNASSTYFEFIVADGGGNSAIVQATSLGSVTSKTWYYIVAWYNSSTDKINIQVNNGSITSVDYSQGSNDGSHSFYLGTDSRTSSGPLLTGYIDEVGFWKRILTSNERTALYNADTGLDPTNLTPNENTVAPYYKFGSKSAKLIAGSNGAADFVIDINPASTSTHTFSFYAYDRTSGNFGGTISSSIIKPLFEGTAQSGATYTDMGGGWWRVSYTNATSNSSNTYGFQVATGKTVYVDGVQFEQKSTASTYTDGTLGTGYSWDGTAHNSTSSRTAISLKYANSGNIAASAGSFSAWIKTPWPGNDSTAHTLFDTDTSAGTLKLSKNSSNNIALADGTNTATKAVTWSAQQWQHIVGTWTSGTLQVYVNGTAGTSTSFSAPTLSTSLYLGQDKTNANLLNSSMSDVRIFDTALSSTQVTDLYQTGLVGHSEGAQIDRAGGFDNKGEPPLAIWHMDEGYGTSAHDSTKLNNDLTFGASTAAPTWSIGQTQNIPTTRNIKFDGANDYLIRSVDSDFDFGTNSFSISGWFRHPSTQSGTDTIIARYGSAGYKVYMNSSGYVCFDIDSDSTWGSSNYDSACSTTNFADSKWHQFTAVKSGTTSITLYIDANQVGQDPTIAATGSLNTASSLYIGIDSDASSNPWDGFIDEMRVYGYARSSAQVKTDFNGGQIGVVMGTSTVDNLQQGLVGYWKMDESSWNGTAGEVIDSSGNGNNGTATNGPSTTGAGQYGPAGNFNQSDNDDYVNLGNDSDFNVTTFTISAWIYRTGTCGTFNHCYIFSDGMSGNSGYAFRIRADESYRPQFSINDSLQNITGTTTINTNQWYHVAMTTNGSEVRIYTNGILETTAAQTQTPSFGGQSSKIGNGNTANDLPFTGRLDEERFYNRVLSDKEIQQLYASAPSPVAYWKLDEKTGTTAVDSSGNGNTSSTFTGQTTWTIGKYGASLIFDGTDDVARIVETSSTDLGTTTNSYSLGAWFKTSTDYAGNAYIVAKDDGSGAYPYALYLNSSEYGCFQISDGTNNPSACGSTTLNDGNWHYITGVRDVLNDKVYVYVDSVQITNTTDSTTATAANNDDVSFGNGGTSYTANDFNGSIDDVKIYNYTRTQKKIVEDMNAGHPAGGSPVGSAVGYWKFDEGSDNTCSGGSNDVCNSGANGSALDGAQSGMATPATAASGWTNSGKFNKALQFDGTDDVVTITNTTAIDFNDNLSSGFTISAWINPDTAGEGSGGQVFWKGANSYLRVDTLSGGRLDIEGKLDLATADANINISSAIATGSWNHIVITYDGAAQITLYINGINRGSNTGSGATAAESNNLLIGGTTTDNFDGAIDEVKVYNYPLSPTEVLIDYNRGSNATLGSLSDKSTYEKQATNQEYCVPGDTTACLAPIGEWKLDEKTGTKAYDTSGNNNTGTITAGTGGWTLGKVGQAYNFDNADTIINAGSGSSMDNLPASGMTLETWIYPKSAGENSLGFIMAKNVGTTPSSGWILRLNSTTSLTFTVDGSTDLVRTTNTSMITQNAWNHVVVSWDGVITTASSVHIYINGVEASYATTTNGASRVDDGTSTFFIGNDSTSASTFDGYIDNVRAFNYARTVSQVAWDYNRGGAVGWWKFDECTGANAYDASGNNNTGTITIGGSGTQTSTGNCSSSITTASWNNGTNGKNNASLNFDGSDDYVTVADSNSLDQSGNISISMWVYPNALTNNEAELIQKGTADDCQNYGIALYQGTQLTLLSSASCSFPTYAGTHSILTTGSWQHVVVTYDGTNVRYYINGHLKDTVAWGGIGSTNGAALVIGGGPSQPSTDFFNGQIDEVRVYNYALTSSQIKNAYNQGSAVRFGPNSGQP